MNSDENRPLKISDLEKASGMGRSTIHYYLREGLLSPPRRTGKTMAYYHAGHIAELRRIRELQEDGYPLTIIKEMKEGSRAWREGSGEEAAPSADRKSQIMEKAVEVFARKGYHKARISDITRAVGLGHSTFYLYFPSKKALFMECVDQVFQAMFSGVWEEIKHVRDPIRRMRMRAEVVLKSYPQFIDILQVLHGTVEDDPRLDAKRREIYASVAKTVQRDIDKAIEEGLVEPVNTEIASYMLVGWLEIAPLLMGPDKGYTSDELLDTLTGLFEMYGGVGDERNPAR
ncbi:MAG: MerR family transcriptional regulator [Actinobacteria bacterium]|jgi:AcrR family transcriptional regulator/predicted DNA-binding transcriptional regulator AlpA|nr:MAG: MerR family transcriptional regulator [Actinomycetota bacterium]